MSTKGDGSVSHDVNDVLNDVASHDDDGIKRDRWGRYLLADPETGEVVPFTRASTIARMLNDGIGLEKWMQRNLAYGIGQREDLFMLAASVASVDETELLQQV